MKKFNARKLMVFVGSLAVCAFLFGCGTDMPTEVSMDQTLQPATDDVLPPIDNNDDLPW